MRPSVAALVALTLTLPACGGSSSSAPNANDAGVRANMEHTIERVLRSRVTAKLPGIGINDVAVVCSATSTTKLLCTSTISASFGMGQCGQLTARQQGTVHSDGRLTWRPDGGDHQRITPC